MPNLTEMTGGAMDAAREQVAGFDAERTRGKPHHPPTDAEMAEWMGLCAAAAPEPSWVVEHRRFDEWRAEDTWFAHAARTALPRLIAEVRRLTGIQGVNRHLTASVDELLLFAQSGGRKGALSCATIMDLFDERDAARADWRTVAEALNSGIDDYTSEWGPMDDASNRDKWDNDERFATYSTLAAALAIAERHAQGETKP